MQFLKRLRIFYKKTPFLCARFFRRLDRRAMQPQKIGFKAWLLMAAEAVICEVGADFAGEHGVHMQFLGQTGKPWYNVVGLIYVFFLLQAFGLIWNMYVWGQWRARKMEKLQEKARCDE